VAFIVQKPSYENVSPGLHRVRLHSILNRGMMDFSGEGLSKPICQPTFTSDQRNAAGTHWLTVSCLATASLSRRSKLFHIASVLLDGQPLPDSSDVDLEALLVGKECGIVVSHRSTKNGVFAHIDSFLAISQLSPAQLTANRRDPQVASAPPIATSYSSPSTSRSNERQDITLPGMGTFAYQSRTASAWDARANQTGEPEFTLCETELN